jgi:molybdopterin converting factor small subunit
MAEEIRLRLRLFGALRDHGSEVELVVPRGASTDAVRHALAHACAIDPALLAISALADDDEVLDESATFDRDGVLAVLPPVCGG